MFIDIAPNVSVRVSSPSRKQSGFPRRAADRTGRGESDVCGNGASAEKGTARLADALESVWWGPRLQPEIPHPNRLVQLRKIARLPKAPIRPRK